MNSSNAVKVLALVRLLAVLVAGLWFAVLTGCATKPMYPPKLKDHERAAMINGIKELAQDHLPPPPGTDRSVRVFALPVKLPQTEVGWEEQVYSFYVWACHPAYPGIGIRKLKELGLLNIDIIGAPLKPRSPGQVDKNRIATDLIEQGFNPTAATEAINNDQVLELVVRAGDIRGPIRIAAYFPTEYRLALAHHRAGQARNAYEAAKRKNETGAATQSASKGTNNSSNSSQEPDSADSYAYAGEATWADQAFVPIRSGDLTTKIQIVDQLEARAAFGDEFPRHFYVGRVFLQNTNSAKKLIVYTTSMRAPVYLYRRNESDNDSHKNSGKSSNSPRATNSHRSAGTPSSSSKVPAVAIPTPLVPDEAQLSQLEAEAIAAERYAFLYEPGFVMNQLASDVESIAGNKTPITLKPADNRLQAVRDNLNSWLGAEKERLKTQIPSLDPALQDKFKDPVIDPKTPDTVRKEILAAWGQLKDIKSAVPITKAYDSFAAATAKLGEDASKPLLALARELVDQRQQHADITAQNDYLNGKSSNRVLAARLLARALQAGLLGTPNAASPFGDAAGLSTGLVDKTSPIVADQYQQSTRVLFSQNPDEQKKLNEFGYIWRDFSRPLTFQAVLNSLILTQNDAARTKWVRAVELAGRVAGGLITLSPLVEEFGREGWTRSVAFYSSVVSPEIGKLLLEDLKTHLTNLGAMSMDTIMVIQPRSVVDRYVFFPRGPINNYPDEFDQHSPAYIVKVLGDDVTVRAELVDTNDTVNRNGRGADELVQDAINAGNASSAAIIAREAQSRTLAANAELAQVLGKLEKILIAYKDPATDVASRNEKLAEIRRIIRDFRVVYDKLGDSAFADLLGQYGVRGDDTAPTIDPLPALHLIAGTASGSLPLPVKDDRTPLQALVIKGNGPDDKLSWRSDVVGDGTALTYRVDANGTNGQASEEKRVIKITIQDHLENTTPAEQTVTVVPLDVELSVDSGTVTAANKTITIPNPKTTRVNLSVTVPLGDSAPEKWTLGLETTNNLDIRPAKIPLNLSAPGRLGATVSLDASGLKDSTTQQPATQAVLTLKFSQGDRVIGSIPYTITAQ